MEIERILCHTSINGIKRYAMRTETGDVQITITDKNDNVIDTTVVSTDMLYIQHCIFMVMKPYFEFEERENNEIN